MSDTRIGPQIALLIKEINSLINHNFRCKFKNSGLTPPQMMVVGMLSHHKRLKISDISNELSLANSTVSGIIDRLEKQELVTRIRSHEDKRKVYIELTDKAKILKDNYINDIYKHFEEILQDTSEKELDIILTGLQTLKKILNK